MADKTTTEYILQDSKVPQIIKYLEHKAVTKQLVHRKTIEHFKRLKKVAADIANVIDHEIQEIDKTVDVEYINVSDFEFQIKFSGDLLVFSMHSNIVTFPNEHVLQKNPYILQDPTRGFFGAIVAYNFLADSLKYNRMMDPGYLLARMFLNKDDHFYIEGVRQLHFLHPDVSQNVLTDEILRNFIESTMLASLEEDSEMPNFEKERVISVQQKLSKTMLGNIQKVGFKTSARYQEK